MIRLLTIITLTLASASSLAQSLNWSFVPGKQLRGHISAGQWKEALASFDSGSPREVMTRKALFSYVLYKAGAPHLAIDSLFEAQNPQKMHRHMKTAWRQSVTEQDVVWNSALFSWDKSFTGIFKSEVSDTLFPYQVTSIPNEKALMKLKMDLPKNPANDSKRDSWTRWLIALWAPQMNRPEIGLEQLGLLRGSHYRPIKEDLLDLTEGRILFQMGRLVEAVRSYTLVPKGSDFWLEALEERSWAYLRLAQSEKALADMKSALSPLMKPFAGPEVYVLTNLSHLDVCDYPAVFRLSQEYKSQFRTRVKGLKSFIEESSQARIAAIVDQLTNQYSLRSISQDAGSLPRHLLRDSLLQRLTSYRRIARNELAQLKSQFPQAAAYSSLGQFMKKTEWKIQKAADMAIQRVRQLAQVELREIKQMTQKMHLIETEVIQRISTEENLASNQKRERDSRDQQDAEVLNFPATDEVWLDEIGNYSVRVKECPGIQRAAL